MLDPDLNAFVRLAVPSSWTLETLLLLRRRAPEALSVPTIVGDLRANDSLVGRCIEQLRLAGLVAIGEDGARYAPATPMLAELCEKLERASIERPLALREAISAPREGDALQKFADAFRFKKDTDE